MGENMPANPFDNRCATTSLRSSCVDDILLSLARDSFDGFDSIGLVSRGGGLLPVGVLVIRFVLHVVVLIKYGLDVHDACIYM